MITAILGFLQVLFQILSNCAIPTYTCGHVPLHIYLNFCYAYTPNWQGKHELGMLHPKLCTFTLWVGVMNSCF